MPAPQVIERDHERTIVKHRAAARIDLDEVRAVVRDELAQSRTDDNVARPTDDKPVIDDARLARATTALDQGMSDGRWTADDRDRLRLVLQTLSQAEMEQVAIRLFPALNSGKLQLVGAGPPL
ncbi:MAG: hypothetical protein H0T65_07470 [Deltaproteobacteria bacterium]|nr:hypothetical protein [Deltaproteobacteria bacterium]